MANQYQYADYSQFQYPNESGDIPFMQGYALSQQMNEVGNALFGGQSISGFPAQNSFFKGKNSSNFPCDYSQLRQFGAISDMQQSDQFFPGIFNNSSAGDFYDNFAQEQDFDEFNAPAYMQRSFGKMGRGFSGFSMKGFQNNQRGGMNRFGNERKSNSLPSVTNPNGLRDDTVFVTNLPQNIDHETIKSNFCAIGKIKTNPKTGMPMIWIFKERGIPKGDALVTYEDTSCVQAAIKYFSENDFSGRKVSVKQAKNSQHPVIIPPGGGNFNNNFDADSHASMSGRGEFEGNSDGLGRNYGRNAGNSRLPGNSNRTGDWVCKICSTGNFSSRDQCIQCSAPRFDDANPKRMIGMGRGGPSRMGPSRGANNGFPAFMNNGGGVIGRGNIQSMRGRGNRGGGPIYGRALTGGRMRPTPY